MLDVFKKNAFGIVSLTESINTLPYVPSRVGSMGLFQEKGVRTLSVGLEYKNGTISLLQTQPRGSGQTTTRTRNPRSMRTFNIPHIPHDDQLLADDLQDVRAFGSETQLQTVSKQVADMLAEMGQNHETTWEWHRIGAVKGAVLDADGSIIYDLFDEFGIVQDTLSFNFATVTTGYLKQKALQVERLMQNALGATPYRGIHAFCGDGFFDNFVSHPEVRESYERFQGNAFARTQQTGPGGFTWGGITWENYRGAVGATQFVDDDKASFFPTGSPGLFKRYNAPADFVETVNTLGKPMYAKQERMKMDKGIEVHTQSNPLHICTRPKCLVEGTDDTP